MIFFLAFINVKATANVSNGRSKVTSFMAREGAFALTVSLSQDTPIQWKPVTGHRLTGVDNLAANRINEVVRASPGIKGNREHLRRKI